MLSMDLQETFMNKKDANFFRLSFLIIEKYAVRC